MSTGQSHLDSLPHLTIEEELRIGSVDDPDYGFTGIGGLDVDRDGQIYVFEATDVQIRVYSPVGQLIRRLGGRGDGPGEFRRTPRFGVLGDTVWAIESSTRRITLFRRDGTVISTAPIRAVTVPVYNMIGNVMPATMREDGLFTSDMTMFSSSRDLDSSVGSNDTVSVPRVLYDAMGQAVDTVGWMPHYPPRQSQSRMIEVGGNRYFVPAPPPDEPLAITLPAGRVVIDRTTATSADPAQITVTRLGLAGDTVYSRAYMYRPRPFDDAALDTRAWQTARTPGGGIPILSGVPTPPPVPDDSMDVFNRIRSEMSFPAYQPPIQRHRLGKDGSLWLIREEDGGPTRRWTILDPEARAVGEVTLDREVYPIWIEDDKFWVIERDEFDVPWIVRYRLRFD